MENAPPPEDKLLILRMSSSGDRVLFTLCWVMCFMFDGTHDSHESSYESQKKSTSWATSTRTAAARDQLQTVLLGLNKPNLRSMTPPPQTPLCFFLCLMKAFSAQLVDKTSCSRDDRISCQTQPCNRCALSLT